MGVVETLPRDSPQAIGLASGDFNVAKAAVRIHARWKTVPVRLGEACTNTSYMRPAWGGGIHTGTFVSCLFCSLEQ